MGNNRYELKTLFWETTLRCNAYCEFCGSRCGDVRSEEVSGEEVLETFRRVAEAFGTEEIMINVTGGEPLLRKDLFEVMGEAADLGFLWGMVTNGALITEDVIAAMKRSGMKTISISLDGLAETHNRLRKIPDGFEKVRRAVQMLSEAGFLDCIQITTVVNRKNITEIEDLYQEIKNWPIDSWRVGTVDPIGRASEEEHEELLLGADQTRWYLKFLKDHQFTSKFEVTTTCAHYYGREDNLYRNHSFRCGAGKEVASILANGDIFVCPNVPRHPEWIQGNIRTDDFVTVWETGFRYFRDEESRKCGPCAVCPQWEKCQGDSLHTWDFSGKKPGICMKELIPERMLPPDPGETASAIRKIIEEKNKESGEPLVGIRLYSGNSSGKTVYLTPLACEELHAYFNWGRTTAKNVCELMAGLVGHVTGGNLFVEAILPSPLEYRDQVTAALSERNRQDVRTDLTVMNRFRNEADPGTVCLEGDYRLLGYVHSHPGNLNVTMSAPDMDSHREYYLREEGDWITMICNPQKRELKAYVNSVYYPADVILVMGEAEVKRWGMREK